MGKIRHAKSPTGSKERGSLPQSLSLYIQLVINY